MRKANKIKKGSNRDSFDRKYLDEILAAINQGWIHALGTGFIGNKEFMSKAMRDDPSIYKRLFKEEIDQVNELVNRICKIGYSNSFEKAVIEYSSGDYLCTLDVEGIYWQRKAMAYKEEIWALEKKYSHLGNLNPRMAGRRPFDFKDLSEKHYATLLEIIKNRKGHTYYKNYMEHNFPPNEEAVSPRQFKKLNKEQK